jgi:hypothetical protein
LDTKRWWIVGHDDKTWGPFELAPLTELVALGKLRADGLVCAEGEQRWSPLSQVNELSDIPWPPPPAPEPAAAGASSSPPPPINPSRGRSSSAHDAYLRPNELEPIHGWHTVLLSIPTLGLWGMFCFYRTMRTMMRMSPRTATNAEQFFWAFLGLGVVGVLTLGIFVGGVLLVGAVVFGALLLRETLRLRELAILQLVPDAASSPLAYPAVKSDDWHFGLWITGTLLTITVIPAFVGVPILIAQALAWFEDWNRLAGLARGRQGFGAALPA